MFSVLPADGTDYTRTAYRRRVQIGSAMQSARDFTPAGNSAHGSEGTIFGTFFSLLCEVRSAEQRYAFLKTGRQHARHGQEIQRCGGWSAVLASCPAVSVRRPFRTRIDLRQPAACRVKRRGFIEHVGYLLSGSALGYTSPQSPSRRKLRHAMMVHAYWHKPGPRGVLDIC